MSNVNKGTIMRGATASSSSSFNRAPIWDSSDPSRNPPPIPMPETGYKRTSVAGSRSRSDLQDFQEGGVSAHLKDLKMLVNMVQEEMSSLTRRSKDNASELGLLKTATHTRDEDIRLVMHDIRNDLRSDTTRESILSSLREVQEQIHAQGVTHSKIEALQSHLHDYASKADNLECKLLDLLDEILISTKKEASPSDPPILELIYSQLEETSKRLTAFVANHNAIEISTKDALREFESLSRKKLAAAAELTSLETAVSIRKEELAELERRAYCLEDRLLNTALEKSRELLLSRPDPAPLFSNGKKSVQLKSSNLKSPNSMSRRHFSLSQIANPNGEQGKGISRKFSIRENVRNLFASKDRENISEEADDETRADAILMPPPVTRRKKAYNLADKPLSSDLDAIVPKRNWRSVSERI